MKILVIVALYNGSPWLDRCLGSVRRSKLAADLFVVDNASTDGSADRVRTQFPEAILHESTENLGFGKANNLGLAYALEKGYDYVYLLNQDAWIYPDTLEVLVRSAEAHPGYAVLSPIQLQGDGRTPDPLFARHILPSVKHDRPVSPVRRVMAAHWLIPAGALRRVGFFDPLFPHYGEDDNWCDRARYLGCRIGVVPAAKAVHDRADRKPEKEGLIRLNCRIGTLRRLCNPGAPLAASCVWTFLFTLVKCVKYRSARPFRHFGDVLGMMPRIREARRREKQRRASLGPVKDPDTHIYIITYKPLGRKLPDTKYLTPLHAGAALHDFEITRLRDDSGENISRKNREYCDVTGIYWIWKNDRARYVGQMQYRRFLDIRPRKVRRILRTYDIIVPRKAFLNESVAAHYARYHISRDLELTCEIIRDLFPEYGDAARSYFREEEWLYYSNGFIMTRERYGQMCSFVFPILSEFEKRAGADGTHEWWVRHGATATHTENSHPEITDAEYQSRSCAYLFERLFSLWVFHNCPRRYEVRYHLQEKKMRI